MNRDPAIPAEAEDPRVRRVEILISTMLRVGVIASLVVIILGIVLTFVQSPELASSKAQYRAITAADAQFPHSLRQVAHGLSKFQGASVVILGLLLLLATPVLRVAISIAAFALQRDTVFTLVTIAVLVLLLASFFLGRVHL